MADECSLRYEYGENGTLINLAKEFGDGKTVTMKMDERVQEMRIYIGSTRGEAKPGLTLTIGEMDHLSNMKEFMKLAEDRFRKPLQSDIFKTKKGFLIIIRSGDATEFQYEPLGPDSEMDVASASTSSPPSRNETTWALLEEVLDTNLNHDGGSNHHNSAPKIENKGWSSATNTGQPVMQSMGQLMDLSVAQSMGQPPISSDSYQPFNLAMTGPLVDRTNRQPLQPSQVIDICSCEASTCESVNCECETPSCECFTPVIRSTGDPYPQFEPVTPVKSAKKQQKKKKKF